MARVLVCMDPAEPASNQSVEAHVSYHDVLAWWRAAMYANDTDSVGDLVDLGRALRASDPLRTIGADTD